jgi:hypothetical protein
MIIKSYRHYQHNLYNQRQKIIKLIIDFLYMYARRFHDNPIMAHARRAAGFMTTAWNVHFGAK